MGFIIFGIIIIVIVIIVVTAVINIKKEVERKVRSVFGTSSIEEFSKLSKDLYENTPKSISSMTRIYLPRITEDFKEFNYTEFKISSENVLLKYLNTIEEKEIYTVRHSSNNLKNQVANIVEELKTCGEIIKFLNPNIHKTEIARYIKHDGICSIYLQSSIEYEYYKLDKTGNVIDGNKNTKKQAAYEIELNYIQDIAKIDKDVDITAIGINCPNCGGAITSLGNKSCEYCGTVIKEVNINSWNFNSIKELD